jgi:hypothetical protein
MLTSSINECRAVMWGNIKYRKAFISSGLKADNESNEMSKHIEISLYTATQDSNWCYKHNQCCEQCMKSAVNTTKCEIWCWTDEYYTVLSNMNINKSACCYRLRTGVYQLITWLDANGYGLICDDNRECTQVREFRVIDYRLYREMNIAEPQIQATTYPY